MKRMQNTSFFVLLTITILMTGCASAPPYKDLVPQQSDNSSRTKPQFDGIIDVRCIIKPEWMASFGDEYNLPLHAYVDNVMLEKALIESVANSALFTQVSQKNADYVLDVWIDDLDNAPPNWGIGAYGARVFSIWRLTRVREGKVLVCDFVDGRGLVNTIVSAPRTKSIVAALKDAIQNGLRVLADTSKEHLAANPVAGIRPSMGSAVPEGLKAWEDKFKKNWSNLHKGLSLKEVENIIGPVETSGALERIYQKYKRGGPDKNSFAYYDEDMDSRRFRKPSRKRFPHYEEYSYILTIDFKTSYYMTHLYVLKFDLFEGLQTWVLR